MIAGEYVVLDGAPAICMALNRRARVSLRPGEAGKHRVCAPGFLQGVRDFSAIGEIAAELPLLAAVWHQYPPATSAALSINIDTREFFCGDEKLGIGSSAAATVALGAAFATLFETALALALFDAGFFVETLRHAQLDLGVDGFALLTKSAELRPDDAEIEFALALASSWPKRRDSHEEHLRLARMRAKTGTLLAANLRSHFGN
jgi:hypothetical protein